MKPLLSVIAAALICCQCSSVYAATRTATLLVPGMDCAACPITIKKALSRVDGVRDVSVSFETKQATVVFDDTKATLDVLTRATADVGFPSTPVPGASK